MSDSDSSEHGSEHGSVAEPGEPGGPGGLGGRGGGQGEQRGIWDMIRRRIAPLAFLVALLVLATRTCSSEVARVDLVLDFGAAAERVRHVRVDMFRQGEDQSALVFERSYGERGVLDAPSFEAHLDPGPYQMLFEVTLGDGVRRFERTVEIADQATITVNLERDLR